MKRDIQEYKETDAQNRNRFVTELDRNFSVIAPAGVGKTTSIVDRIIHLATNDPVAAEKYLPKLVVVTFTNKAAQEMQERARRRMIHSGVNYQRMSAFNQAFFGTIHSFAMKLLKEYGRYIRLPGTMELDSNDERTWLAFLRQLNEIPVSEDLGHENFLRYVSLFDVLKIAGTLSPSIPVGRALSSKPRIDTSAIHACRGTKISQVNVSKAQEALRLWEEREKEPNVFNPIPPTPTKGGAKFIETWVSSISPLKEWVRSHALELAHRLAVEYRQYRMNHGLLTYDDQISLVLELLRHPIAGRKIREKGYVVILDEAQDTDPYQFSMLLEVAGTGGSAGKLWIESDSSGELRPGAFCMVGDPQQSIYGDRADLSFYRKVSDRLLRSGGEEILFHMTFRSRPEIVDRINQIGESLLTGTSGQVEYVPLLSGKVFEEEGQILCIETPVPDGIDDLSTTERMKHEAGHLAHWIKEQGHQKLGAKAWSEVAILCLRKSWFEVFQEAFRCEGLRTQLHSGDKKFRENPVCAWITALSMIIAEPENGFEIVGVLRDIFGISDQKLYEFVHEYGGTFQIVRPMDERDIVSKYLNRLHELRKNVLGKNLRDGVETLVEGVELSVRLKSLKDFEVQDHHIRAFLARAASLEEEGKDFYGWVQYLSDMAEKEDLEEKVVPDAIQLLTWHKAKGLEWDAVILPFLFRELRERSKQYPCLRKRKFGEPFGIAFDSSDLEKDEKPDLLQERQRLLYVALTRARRSLVLVNNKALYPDARNSIGLNILGEEGEKLFKENKAVSIIERKSDSSRHSAHEKGITLEDLKNAGTWNASHIKRILPHSLAEKSQPQDPEQRLLKISDEEKTRAIAMEYGTWWHEMSESMPWGDAGNWENIFEERKTHCPDRNRAEEEWKLFKQSELASFLKQDHLVIHTEMPVFRSIDENQCIEGLVDLAVFHPEKKTWMIIDWKTDHLKDISKILAFYRGQLEAYRTTVKALTGIAAVKAGIYSTANGEWIFPDE